MKFHFNSFYGCQVTERTRNSIANDQREITPKISKAELWFLCMTQCLIVRYKCMKFQQNSFNSAQLTERTRNCIYLRYKGDNLKYIYMQELRFLCMTRRLNVLYKCMPFRLNICNGYQDKEQTRFCDYLCYKGGNLKSTHARVIVLVHDTLSQCALQMFDVSLK